eukprot:gene15811-biopygen693
MQHAPGCMQHAPGCMQHAPGCMQHAPGCMLLRMHAPAVTDGARVLPRRQPRPQPPPFRTHGRERGGGLTLHT